MGHLMLVVCSLQVIGNQGIGLFFESIGGLNINEIML